MEPKDPCDREKLHKEAEHDIVERIAEGAVGTLREVHKDALRDACREKERQERSGGDTDRGGRERIGRDR